MSTETQTTIPTSMTDKVSEALNTLAAGYETEGLSKDEATLKALQEFKKVWK